MYSLDTYEHLMHKCRHRPYDTNCTELSDALSCLIHEVRRLKAQLDIDESFNGKLDPLTRAHYRIEALDGELARLRAENIALRKRIDQLGDGA